MVEEVRRLPLLDAVFAFVHHRSKRHEDDRGILRRPLTEILRDVEPAQLEAAKFRVWALLADAYRYGDEWHSQRARAALGESLPIERDLDAEMRRDHPGFSRQSYTAAMHKGLFEAMW